MGQYFRAVNTDKKEYVCPWCIGGGAKLWEWAVNRQGAIFTLLLRQSTGGGGGDFYGYHNGSGEGDPVSNPNPIVGRWAGDRVSLVGDYDESGLFDECDNQGWKNISQELAETWNRFMGPRHQIEYRDCECHK